MKTLYIFEGTHWMDFRPYAHWCTQIRTLYFDWEPPSYYAPKLN